jgi:hypothetical protein
MIDSLAGIAAALVFAWLVLLPVINWILEGRPVSFRKFWVQATGLRRN